MVCYGIFWSGQHRGGAASLRHGNRYRTHFAAHAPPRDRYGGLFTPHRKLAQGLNLTMRPMKILTAGDILGLFEESFQKFG